MIQFYTDLKQSLAIKSTHVSNTTDFVDGIEAMCVRAEASVYAPRMTIEFDLNTIYRVVVELFTEKKINFNFNVSSFLQKALQFQYFNYKQLNSTSDYIFFIFLCATKCK